MVGKSYGTFTLYGTDGIFQRCSLGVTSCSCCCAGFGGRTCCFALGLWGWIVCIRQFFMCDIRFSRASIPDNWVFSLIARVLFRSGTNSVMLCRVFGVIYWFVNWPEIVCGIAMAVGLMGFCRFRVVWTTMS